MMEQSSFDRFSEWMANHERLTGPAIAGPPAFAIMLAPNSAVGDLAEALAVYLNEYDEAAAGAWMAFDRGSLHEILERGGLDHFPRWPFQAETGFVPENPNLLEKQRLLLGLVRLGSVIITEDQDFRGIQPSAGVFSVGLSRERKLFSGKWAASFHLVLNVPRFRPESLVPIIGDSALEWARPAHRELRIDVGSHG